MVRKIQYILINALPILIMIGLIPMISDDYILTGAYITITLVSLFFQRGIYDMLIYFSGFFLMTLFESIFISTGVEVFNRNTLFGIMPLWLPFLWAYGFIAIRRTIDIIES